MSDKHPYNLGSDTTGTLLGNDTVRLDRSYGKQAVETLVRAFRNQQPFQYYFPDEAERETPYLIAMAIFPGIKYGEVHATSYDMEGIAIWVPSDNYPITPWRIFRSVPLFVTIGFVRYGGYRLNDFGRYKHGACSVCPFQAHVFTVPWSGP